MASVQVKASRRMAAVGGATLVAVSLAWNPTRAQERPAAVDTAPEQRQDPEGSAKRLEELKRAAAEYRITLDSEPPRPLALKPEPVLRWTNPLRQTDDGAVFLWLSEGRPEVAASFYRHRRDEVFREDHEFQSLATSPLRATRGGVEVWSPPIAGINLIPIPGAPAPGSTPGERTRQLRALAHEFKAFFDDPKNQSELRLLSKPVYRYESRRADVVDGALFAFVQATDPEVLLLIEARSKGNAQVWQYGFARMSMVDLRAEHKDQIVWRAEWVDQVEAPNKPYVTLLGAERATADGAKSER